MEKAGLDTHIMTSKMIFPCGLNLTLNNLEKRLSKGFIEEGVEERVDHGGGVAKPGDKIDHLLPDVSPAGDEHVGDEERGPQQDEREENHTQNL